MRVNLYAAWLVRGKCSSSSSRTLIAIQRAIDDNSHYNLVRPIMQPRDHLAVPLSALLLSLIAFIEEILSLILEKKSSLRFCRSQGNIKKKSN